MVTYKENYPGCFGEYWVLSHNGGQRVGLISKELGFLPHNSSFGACSSEDLRDIADKMDYFFANGTIPEAQGAESEPAPTSCIPPYRDPEFEPVWVRPFGERGGALKIDPLSGLILERHGRLG